MLNTNNYIIIKVSNHIDRFIRKCINSGIELYTIEHINNENIIVKVKFADYHRLKKLNYYCKISIIRYEGLNFFKNHFYKYYYTYIVVFLCFILMDIVTSYVFEIKIIHENTSIRSLLKQSLADNGIEKNRLAKSFDELENIKNKIIDNNPSKLEWMSITRIGMKYIIRAEERIIKNTQEETGFRHIISTKDALITKIVSTKGEVIVRSGDYVKKGNILISGNIKLYDSIKGDTLATGTVYGNVWYTVDISIPMQYMEKRYLDKSRLNLNINNKILLKNKYKYFEQKNMRELQIFWFKIKIYKEQSYELIKVKLTEKEALNIALEKIEKEFLVKLNNNGKIIEKKVLKKEQNNSTIDIRVFVVTNELISDNLYYTPGSDNNDTSNSS